MSTTFLIGNTTEHPDIGAALASDDIMVVHDTSSGRVKSTPLSRVNAYIGSGALVAAGATLAVTQVLHAGKTIALDTLAGSIATLPAATGSGSLMRFVVSVLATSNSHIVKVANTADVIQGSAIMVSTTASASTFFATNATTDTITLNRTTTGSVTKGEYLELQDIAANTWAVSGMLTNSGTGSTPFSATV